MREIPNAFLPVLLDGDIVIYPSGEKNPYIFFKELVEEGNATSFSPILAQPQFCVYLPEGDVDYLYIPIQQAAKMFKSFAQMQTNFGDKLFALGDKDTALAYYEKAAAAAQDPFYYEKMLSCPMSQTRRDRIEKLLASSRANSNEV